MSGPPQPVGECGRTRRTPLPYSPEISDMLKIAESYIFYNKWKVIFYDMNFILNQIQ